VVDQETGEDLSKKMPPEGSEGDEALGAGG
jgi:hypothetical protein